MPLGHPVSSWGAASNMLVRVCSPLSIRPLAAAFGHRWQLDTPMSFVQPHNRHMWAATVQLLTEALSSGEERLLRCCCAGRTLQGGYSVSAQDAVNFAQGAVAAANGGNCGQAQTALNLAESSPAATSSACCLYQYCGMLQHPMCKQSILSANVGHFSRTLLTHVCRASLSLPGRLTCDGLALLIYTDSGVQQAIQSAQSKIAATPCGNMATQATPAASLTMNGGRRLRGGAHMKWTPCTALRKSVAIGELGTLSTDVFMKYEAY